MAEMLARINGLMAAAAELNEITQKVKRQVEAMANARLVDEEIPCSVYPMLAFENEIFEFSPDAFRNLLRMNRALTSQLNNLLELMELKHVTVSERPGV